ncbi:Rha family transcriptional regulator [Turicimonas muris]|uniref:Rha family transcriptional regulator n=1 Tax=Turicimonas muris TaxID=1796652 RepID=UPI00249524F3|nr:Rha family transcriptional regulator [Turicimonas muris]
MLTNTLAMRQNINAVENGQRGLGGPSITGALRHLIGGIFVRACFAFTSEHRGTSKDVLRPVSWSANPRCLALHLGGWKRGFYQQHRSLVMQQANQSIGASAPILSITQNKVTALSTDVAKFFGKIHRNVVRDIEELISKLPSPRVLNFERSEIPIPSNLKNAPAKIIKAYRMTRDGFTLLVMGWTGEKALQFKLAWLDAFNKMEEELRAQQQLPTLPPASPLGKSVAPAIAATPMTREQLEAVRAQVQERFPDNKDALRAFSILQHHFRVVSYRQIPQARFEEVMEFAQHFVLPQLKPKKPKALPALCSSALSSKGDFVLPHVTKDHMAAHYAIVIHDGEPTMYELGKKWKLAPINNFEWTKAYCETEMPSELIPGLMNTLVRRMQQEAKK